MATNHRGVLLAIQYETATPGTWANLCGVNNVTFSVTNALQQDEQVACTDRDSVIRTLQTYGAQSMSLSYDGIFDSDADGVRVTDAARTQALLNLRVFVPGDGYYEADWAISNVEWQGGSGSGKLRNSGQLASSGAVTYTAA